MIPLTRTSGRRAPVPGVCGSPAALGDAVRAARAAFPVALVTMPFALPTRPSLQIGLLGELARSHGYPVDLLHLNLELAARMGVERFHTIACTRNPMFGDWLFSREAFREDAPDQAGTLPEDVAPLGQATLADLGVTGDEMRAWRAALIPAYLDDMMAAADWSRYRVVGFTSTFQQNVASFALARRIKEAHPHVTIVFGGSNFDGPMGAAWMEAVPWIDLAITGEADRGFPLLLHALCDEGDPLAVPGVIGRKAGCVATGPSPVPFDDMDALPIPDYSDFFERAEAVALLADAPIREIDLPFESSRGCWWGDKAVCRFCGLNGSTMTYRTKSPARVLEELQVQARRYRSLAFAATDNILNLEYLKTLFAPLAASDASYWLFYEIKANVTRQDVRLLSQAGVRALQPGIESLSTRLLHEMKKGTRASQNVNFLRWARHYDIEVYWNILRGFPGETENDYVEQARLARQLVHLPPPSGTVRIGLERFSPYYEDAARFPVRGGRARPEPGYAHTYPAHVDLDRAAYHFAGELEGSLTEDRFDPLHRALAAWQDRWRQGDRPSLKFWWSPGLLQIEDRRSALAPQSYAFDDPAAAVYASCSDAPASAAELVRRVAPGGRADAIHEALDEFCRLGVMMRDGSVYLALALPGAQAR